MGAPNHRKTPRWVKAFVVAALLFAAAFIILHAAGMGLGEHMPAHGMP